MRVPPLTPDRLSLNQRKLYDDIVSGPRGSGPQHFSLVKDDGSLDGPFGLMLIQPAIGRPLQELGAAIRFETTLTERVREIAILAVAAATDCAFERYAHERVGRAVGLTDLELTGLRAGVFQSTDAAEQHAYDFCARLVTGELPRSADSFAEFERSLGSAAVLELIVLVGYYRTLSQMINIYDVQPRSDHLPPRG